MNWRNQPKTFWKERLSEIQYKVTQEASTERAFTGEYCNSKGEGRYVCVCCASALFESDTKFDSGTGWPSFYDAISGSLEFKSDRSWFSERTEVLCKTCGAHLGHVFDDGPKPTGKRYCMNSAALNFPEKKP